MRIYSTFNPGSQTALPRGRKNSKQDFLLSFQDVPVPEPFDWKNSIVLEAAEYRI
jgi:hypothetical protein